MLQYYDHSTGRTRLKRRYVWGLWSFLAGLLIGVVLSANLMALAIH